MARDVLDLGAWQRERLDAAGQPLRIDEETTIVVPPIDLWPDDRDRGGDDAFLLFLVGSEDNVERFRAAGGTLATLLRIMVRTDDVGESADSPAS